MLDTTRGARKRVVTLALAGGFAASGMFALTAGPAQATPGDPHKVWVCKYVKKPGQAETLKSGKNPIFVDWASLTGKQGEPHVGDTFSDAHDKSVVVQIGGSNPGVGACKVTTPTNPPTTNPPKTNPPTTNPPKTNPPKTNPPGGGGGGKGGGTPAPNAPDTGGAGDVVSVNSLIGSGLLLAAAGVVGADALRRRRVVNQH